MLRKPFATLVLSLFALFMLTANAAEVKSKRPNVILILADDLGCGDLGFYGNPKIKTPHLDKLARESTRFEYFYVSPVCSPTRASLMTGRYSFRSGVFATAFGGQLMYPEELTIAEMFAAAGYRTGIFGKWHLGDSYPMRSVDQGFAESLVIRDGATDQLACPAADSNFNPLLLHNGRPTKSRGYSSDIFTDAAMRFMSENREQSFFLYLPLNTPHTPLEVPHRYLQHYKQMNLDHSEFPVKGHPLDGKADQEMISRIYGMVSNFDDNVGRLLTKLDDLKLAGNTIVIFLSDNGPNQARYDNTKRAYVDATNKRPLSARYNCGMRDLKGSVYEGGIRVPFFVRWPGKVSANKSVDRIAAHIDVAPTLLDACEIAKPIEAKLDGVSLLPLMKGEQVANWPDRTLFFQWHTSGNPQLHRAFAARSQKYKLVQPIGVDGSELPKQPSMELYDMAADPLELKNIADQRPELVATMRADYERWFQEVTSMRDYSVPSRIYLGAPQENPTTLTWHDSRGPFTDRYFDVEVAQAGTYRIALRFSSVAGEGTAYFSLGTARLKQEVKPGATKCNFDERVHLDAGPARLKAGLEQGGKPMRIECVEVRRLK